VIFAVAELLVQVWHGTSRDLVSDLSHIVALCATNEHTPSFVRIGLNMWMEDVRMDLHLDAFY